MCGGLSKKNLVLSYANAFFYFDLKDNEFHVITNPFKDSHDSYVGCYVEEEKDIIRIILSSKSSLKININNQQISKIRENVT